MQRFGKEEGASLPSFLNLCMYLVLYLIYRYFPFHVAPSLLTPVPPLLPPHTYPPFIPNSCTLTWTFICPCTKGSGQVNRYLLGEGFFLPFSQQRLTFPDPGSFIHGQIHVQVTDSPCMGGSWMLGRARATNNHDPSTTKYCMPVTD